MTRRDRPILSIEDSDEDYYSICHALKAAGVPNPVTRCADARQALALLESESGCDDARRAALVLLDLNMPGIDGLELLQRFRARGANTPVVVLSTSSHRRDVARSYDAGANAFVQKPFDLEQWQEKLARIAGFWLDTVVLPSAQPSSGAG